MTASMGAELDTGTNAETTVTPPTATPTPMSAVNSGIPAANSDPKAMKSTTPAKSTPSPSVMVSPKVWSWKTCPPNATVMSPFLPVSPTAFTPSMVFWETSVDALSSCTWV